MAVRIVKVSSEMLPMFFIPDEPIQIIEGLPPKSVLVNVKILPKLQILKHGSQDNGFMMEFIFKVPDALNVPNPYVDVTVKRISNYDNLKGVK